MAYISYSPWNLIIFGAKILLKITCVIQLSKLNEPFWYLCQGSTFSTRVYLHALNCVEVGKINSIRT